MDGNGWSPGNLYDDRDGPSTTQEGRRKGREEDLLRVSRKFRVIPTVVALGWVTGSDLVRRYDSGIGRSREVLEERS